MVGRQSRWITLCQRMLGDHNRRSSSTSQGPVFFRQKRYGFNNELVEIYKFRSMHADKLDFDASKLGDARRSARDPSRPLHPQDLDRRIAAALQRGVQGRSVARRARVHTRFTPRRRTGNTTKSWTAISRAIASSRASPAGRRCTAGAAKRTRTRRSSSASITISTISRTGRSCSISISWRSRRLPCSRLGAFFCNFVILPARQPESRPVSPAPYQILWVRGCRAHTISGRESNLFKPLRRHFRATSVLPSGPLAPRSRRPKHLGSKDRRSSRRSPPGRRVTRTNIEHLRNSGKKFVERVGNCATSDPRVAIVACEWAPNFFWSPQRVRRVRP